MTTTTTTQQRTNEAAQALSDALTENRREARRVREAMQLLGGVERERLYVALLKLDIIHDALQTYAKLTG